MLHDVTADFECWALIVDGRLTMMLICDWLGQKVPSVAQGELLPEALHIWQQGLYV